MRPDSLVLTIQNGLGAAERIAAHMPLDNVLLGVADGFGASMKGPGHAHHNAMRMIRLGEVDGGMTDRLRDLESLWQQAGFTARAFADITQLIWEKFVCNVTLSAPCTAFDCNIGGVDGECGILGGGAWLRARGLSVRSCRRSQFLIRRCRGLCHRIRLADAGCQPRRCGWIILPDAPRKSMPSTAWCR
jgi:hypothetical protein